MESTIAVAEQSGQSGIIFTMPQNETTSQMITRYHRLFINCAMIDKNIKQIEIGGVSDITLYRIKCGDNFSRHCSNLEYLSLSREERHRYSKPHQYSELLRTGASYAITSLMSERTLAGYEPYATIHEFRITVRHNGFMLHHAGLTSDLLSYDLFNSRETTPKNSSIEDILASVI